MIIIKDIPSIALRKAVFALLKDGQETPVYGGVPTGAKLPYITLGSGSFKPLAVKDSCMWQTSLAVEVWGTLNGKRDVNETLNNIAVLLSYYGNSMKIPDYQVIETEIDMVEDFPELTTGYHGTLTARFLLQRIED